ncbi:MAG: hypothetical protein H0A76_12285 [Candidatus Thiodubiliella endoseptemdiera]|uniref:Uncharacterized protein n=1 Tax=Candidatus Thiodubiliella endoseptemdiera TaxID=2738886 RepID=A0A853F5A7_9GAMM|nr:hypothetical protein [Candidatus Thiodubiliella endoseptemdiera]
MPAFLVEFVLTGGLANLIVKGGKKAVVSAVKTSVTRKAKQLATVVGVQTALNPQRTVEKYYSRRVEYTTKGFNILKDSVETPATSFFKAFFDVYIELGTEHAGGFVSDLGLGRASAKLAQSRVGKRLAYGLRKLAVEGKGKEVNKMLSRAGFHGVLAEIGEERLYDLISGVTGVREQPGNPRPIFDRIMDVIPEADKFLVEAGVISIVGGASRSTGLAIDLLARNKKSVKGYDVKYEVSEEDKDSLVEAAYKPTKYSLNIEEATEYNKALQDLSSEDVDISLKSLAVVAKHESRLDSTKTKKNKTNEIIGKIKTMLRVVDEQNTPRDLDIDLDRPKILF